MSTIQKQQHYVWRHHLEAWEGDSKQLFCLWKSQKKVRPSKAKNIGKEGYFYETFELSVMDNTYIELFMRRASSSELRESNRGFVRLFQLTFKLRKSLEAETDKKKKKEIEALLDAAEKTVGETYHTTIELQAIPIIDALRKQDGSFYNDLKNCLTFIYFLSNQLFRTKRMREIIISAGKNKIPGYDPQRTAVIEQLIFANNTGFGLFIQREKYFIVFLTNKSPRSFITSDQPVINLLGSKDSDVCLYFPTSPNTAIIFTTDKNKYPSAQVDADEALVNELNGKIMDMSFDQIYSNNKEYLEELAAEAP